MRENDLNNMNDNEMIKAELDGLKVFPDHMRPEPNSESKSRLKSWIVGLMSRQGLW